MPVSLEKTPIPNHEASPIMEGEIAKFNQELGSDLRLDGDLRVIEARVLDAHDALKKITSGLPLSEYDGAVANYVNEANGTGDYITGVQGTEVGVFEVAEHPGEAVRTASELDAAPVDTLATALKDLEVVNSESLEGVIEAIESAARNNPRLVSVAEATASLNWAEDPATKARALRIAVDKDSSLPHTLSELAPRESYTNKYAHTSRIPVSLPVRNTEISKVRYATPDEMEETLVGYGVDEDAIQVAKDNGWDIPLNALPPELRKTITAANIYEAVVISHDSAAKARASERNACVTLQDIWRDSTLHHVTSRASIGPIIENGQTGFALIDGQVRNTGGVQSGNLNFGITRPNLPAETSNQERMNLTAYSNANGRGADVYVHYVRDKDSYRAGEEYHDGGNIGLIEGGLPSTEISALMMRKENDIASFQACFDAIEKAGFFIPIFDADGTLLFSKEEYDEESIPEAIRGKRKFDAEQQVWETRQRAAREAQEKEERAKHEDEARSKGMTSQEYTAWKQSQPVVRPEM